MTVAVWCMSCWSGFEAHRGRQKIINHDHYCLGRRDWIDNLGVLWRYHCSLGSQSVLLVGYSVPPTYSLLYRLRASGLGYVVFVSANRTIVGAASNGSSGSRVDKLCLCYCNLTRDTTTTVRVYGKDFPFTRIRRGPSAEIINR